LLQRDIHSMASSYSWCSCVKLPANHVTGHLCTRCSLSVVAGRSGCRSVSFSFPTYVGCMSSCSGHFWVGSSKPIHHEIVLGSWAQVEVVRGHQWEMHCWWLNVATGLSIPRQCRILPLAILSLFVTLTTVCMLGGHWCLTLVESCMSHDCVLRFSGWVCQQKPDASVSTEPSKGLQIFAPGFSSLRNYPQKSILLVCFINSSTYLSLLLTVLIHHCSYLR